MSAAKSRAANERVAFLAASPHARIEMVNLGVKRGKEEVLNEVVVGSAAQAKDDPSSNSAEQSHPERQKYQRTFQITWQQFRHGLVASASNDAVTLLRLIDATTTEVWILTIRFQRNMHATIGIHESKDCNRTIRQNALLWSSGRAVDSAFRAVFLFQL